MTSVESAPPAHPEVPRGARVLSAVGHTLITIGVVVLLFVVFQLWGTNIQEARAQDKLRAEFDEALSATQPQLPEDTAPPVVGTADLPPATASTLPGGFDPAVLAYFFPENGDAVARIEIPAIGVDKIVVNGVEVDDLRNGPGHYPGTAAAGTEGNTSIAGHRTTYGKPFNRIDELRPGDAISVTGILGRFTYRVMTPEVAFPEQLPSVDAEGAGHIIVVPEATWVLGDFGDNRLTLTACHPKLSSRQRIVVAAALEEDPVATPEFDPEMVAELLGPSLVEPQLPGEELSDDATDDVDPASGSSAPAPDLEAGLSGDRSAIPGAVAWMVAAMITWLIGGLIARKSFPARSHRVAVRLVVLVPAAACLWFSFEMIDRALPAG